MIRLLPLVRRVGRAGIHAVRNRLLSERERAIEEWKAAGLERLRTAYDLDEHATVVDAGGYEGQWASDVFARFRCTVHVYEPAPEFAARIRERFARNPSIVVHEAGLAGSTREATLALDDVGSSIVGDAASSGVRVRLVGAAEAFREAGLDRIDLLKLNVEGAEYEILEHLLDEGLGPRIRNLQVQFHDIGSETVARTARLRERLSETHELMWRKELVWESWRLREP